jgi:hypothetical protein
MQDMTIRTCKVTCADAHSVESSTWFRISRLRLLARSRGPKSRQDETRLRAIIKPEAKGKSSSIIAATELCEVSHAGS